MQAQVQKLEPWLALSHMPGMRSQLFNTLLKHFDTPANILSRDQKTLVALGLKPKLRAAIMYYQVSKRSSLKVDQCLTWLEQEHHYIFTQGCQGYPSLLKQIPDPPPLLYVKGDPNSLALPQIAMVGSRKPSPGGRKNARWFAQQLSASGYSICSGMAMGIDYESHFGALEKNGTTLAVLGTGIDCVYPRQHRQLAEDISAQGALISEFPLGTRPNAWNFPQRNRIISGLSQGVLVVEAALRSGSLISARFALEQGREVFAIPGSIHNPNARGCHYLLSEGAKLVEKVEDVLVELESFFCLEQSLQKAKGKSGKAQQKQQETDLTLPRAVTQLSTNMQSVLATIDYDLTNTESVIANTGLDVSEINVILVELELANLIAAEAGGYRLL